MTQDPQRGMRPLSTSDIAGTNQPPQPATEKPQRDEGAETSLFLKGEAEGFETRWSAIQTGFVDEPRNAVEQADALVAEVMRRLAEVFSEERSKLERQWDRGDQISTEDLRVALRRYRTFFGRLLAV